MFMWLYRAVYLWYVLLLCYILFSILFKLHVLNLLNINTQHFQHMWCAKLTGDIDIQHTLIYMLTLHILSDIKDQ